MSIFAILGFLKETVSDEALFLFEIFAEKVKNLFGFSDYEAVPFAVQVETSIKKLPDARIIKNRYSFPVFKTEIAFEVVDELINKGYLSENLRYDLFSFIIQTIKKNFQLTLGVDYGESDKKIIKFYSHYGEIPTEEKNGVCLAVLNGSSVVIKKYKKIKYEEYSHMLKRLSSVGFDSINIGLVAGVYDEDDSNYYSEYHFVLNRPVFYSHERYIAVVCLKIDGTVTFYLRNK